MRQSKANQQRFHGCLGITPNSSSWSEPRLVNYSNLLVSNSIFAVRVDIPPTISGGCRDSPRHLPHHRTCGFPHPRLDYSHPDFGSRRIQLQTLRRLQRLLRPASVRQSRVGPQLSPCCLSLYFAVFQISSSSAIAFCPSLFQLSPLLRYYGSADFRSSRPESPGSVPFFPSRR